MSLDSASIPTAGTSASARQAYQTPRLTVFGSITSLTATGSQVGMEDFIQNNMCSNFLGLLNMTFNMC
jgi:hypothetical protein